MFHFDYNYLKAAWFEPYRNTEAKEKACRLRKVTKKCQNKTSADGMGEVSA